MQSGLPEEVGHGNRIGEVRSNRKSESRGDIRPPEPVFQTSRRRTILLVEDEALVRDVMDEVLQSVGYRLLKTRSAEEALQVYQRWGGELHCY